MCLNIYFVSPAANIQDFLRFAKGENLEASFPDMRRSRNAAFISEFRFTPCLQHLCGEAELLQIKVSFSRVPMTPQ
jgi:hypothetical protein